MVRASLDFLDSPEVAEALLVETGLGGAMGGSPADWWRARGPPATERLGHAVAYNVLQCIHGERFGAT